MMLSHLSNYPIRTVEEANVEDNNFLYLYYRPEDFYDIISVGTKEFYRQVRDKNINILIYLEGFDLFSIPDIFEKNLEINNIEYWRMVNFFNSHGIDEDHLYFITAADGYQQDIELLKQKKIVWINQVRPVRSKFFSFNPFLPWGAMQKDIEIKEKKFEKTYASLSNGRPAKHRYNFTKTLWKEDLLKDGLVSMCHMENGDREFESHLPILFDNAHNLWQSNSNENNIFQKSFLWVSNETYMDNKLTLFSEKTVRPMIYMNPFVINGDLRTLAYLKKLGFRTFDEFWDESYDSIENDEDRQNEIIKIIKHLKTRNLQELYDKMRPILEHNRNVLMNTKWNDHLNEFLKS